MRLTTTGTLEVVAANTALVLNSAVGGNTKRRVATGSTMMERMLVHKNPVRFDGNSYVHFVTTNTDASRPYFADSTLCCILLEELRFYSRKLGFTIVGYVIMPNHVHLLLWWDVHASPTLTISRVMQAVKGATARRIIDSLTGRSEHPLRPIPRHREQMLSVAIPTQTCAKAHKRNLKYRLWQQGFYDFAIHSDDKLLEKLDYIHGNPVRAGLVASPGDYEWSSYRFYILEGHTLADSMSTAGTHVADI